MHLPRGRRAILKNQKKICLSIEDRLHRKAVDHAFDLRIRGGFSELVARLLVRELTHKRGEAAKYSRHLPTKQQGEEAA